MARCRQLTDEDSLRWLLGEARIARAYSVTQELMYKSGRLARIATALSPFVRLTLKDRVKWLGLGVLPSMYGRVFGVN